MAQAEIFTKIFAFKNEQSKASFLFASILSQTKYRIKAVVDFSGPQTRIVGVEGEHGDHHHGEYFR